MRRIISLCLAFTLLVSLLYIAFFKEDITQSNQRKSTLQEVTSGSESVVTTEETSLCSQTSTISEDDTDEEIGNE